MSHTEAVRKVGVESRVEGKDNSEGKHGVWQSVSNKVLGRCLLLSQCFYFTYDS